MVRRPWNTQAGRSVTARTGSHAAEVDGRRAVLAGETRGAVTHAVTVRKSQTGAVPASDVQAKLSRCIEAACCRRHVARFPRPALRTFADEIAHEVVARSSIPARIWHAVVHVDVAPGVGETVVTGAGEAACSVAAVSVEAHRRCRAFVHVTSAGRTRPPRPADAKEGPESVEALAVVLTRVTGAFVFVVFANGSVEPFRTLANTRGARSAVEAFLQGAFVLRELTAISGETLRTDALKTVVEVHARALVRARIAETVIYVGFAVASSKPSWAKAEIDPGE